MLTEPVFGLGSWAFNNAPGSVSSLRLSQPVWGLGKGMVAWGRADLAAWRLIKLWRRGLLVGPGLWAQAALGGALCAAAWQRRGFCYNPLAGIAVPCGGFCMALEASTALGVTEDGAEFGLRWQVYANVPYLL